MYTSRGSYPALLGTWKSIFCAPGMSISAIFHFILGSVCVCGGGGGAPNLSACSLMVQGSIRLSTDDG